MTEVTPPLENTLFYDHPPMCGDFFLRISAVLRKLGDLTVFPSGGGRACRAKMGENGKDGAQKI